MKFLISTLIIAILSIMLQVYFPWWCVAIAAGVVAIVARMKPWQAFLSGFLGIGLVWLTHAWMLDAGNNSLLSGKIAQILPIGSTMGLLLLTAAVGALVGGFSALTGSLLRK